MALCQFRQIRLRAWIQLIGTCLATVWLGGAGLADAQVGSALPRGPDVSGGDEGTTPNAAAPAANKAGARAGAVPVPGASKAAASGPSSSAPGVGQKGTSNAATGAGATGSSAPGVGQKGTSNAATGAGATGSSASGVGQKGMSNAAAGGTGSSAPGVGQKGTANAATGPGATASSAPGVGQKGMSNAAAGGTGGSPADGGPQPRSNAAAGGTGGGPAAGGPQATPIAGAGTSAPAAAGGEPVDAATTLPAAAPDLQQDDAAKAEAAKARNCFLDLTSPPGGNVRFAEGAPFLYLLAQLGGADDGKRSTPGSRQEKTLRPELRRSRYVLLKINLKTRKSTRLVAFTHFSAASLLTFGTPVDAAVSAAFGGRGAGCYSGPASLLQVSFASNAHAAVKATGSYEMVETPAGRMLVDLSKNSIVSIDPLTFQRRAVRAVAPGQRALFFDPLKKALTTWTAVGDDRGLATYEGATVTRRLRVAKGDRVLQSGGLFATVHLNLKDNSLIINELPAWSGVGKEARYVLSVPATYAVASAGMDVHFGKRLALVYGANFAAKQKWQRLFIFDYGKNQMLAGVPVSGNDYLNYTAIDPSGSYVFIEVRDRLTRATTGAKLFDIAQKTFADISLDLGVGDKGD